MRRLAKRALTALGYKVVTQHEFRYIPEQQPKADSADNLARFREIISDPLNLLIERVPEAGYVDTDGRVVLHNGHRVFPSGDAAYYGSFSEILILNRGVHEPLEEYIFQELLRKLTGTRPLMIELGAYWAHYSMWMKKVCPQGVCVMVDPDAQALRVGRENFGYHGYEGEFINRQVSSDDFRLDQFAAERRFERLDVLHCDIQGHETEMIANAATLFREQRVGAALISTHSEGIHRAVADRLAEFGYRIEVSSPFDVHSTSHDGLIFALAPTQPALFEAWTPLGRLDINKANPRDLVEYARRTLAATYRRH